MQRVRRWLNRAGRRLGALRDRLWFQWFVTRRAFALFVAGLVVLIGDLMRPFESILPRPLQWVVETSHHYGMTLLQFVLALVAIGTAGQLVWSYIRARRVDAMELRTANATPDDQVRGVRGRDDSFVLVRGENGVVALNSAVDSALDQASNPIHRARRPYALPRNLAPWKPLAIPHINPFAVNEPKVGLRTEIDAAMVKGRATVVLQDTDYMRDRCSNGVIVKDVFDCDRNEVAWRGRSCFVSDDGWLLPLESAFASNQLGGSTLLIDSAWNLHVTLQGSDAAESADLWAPTGSGSFDLRRLPRRLPDFQTFARDEIERELREETGLAFRRDEILTVLIGFGRYLYRGGKPEVFAVSALRRPVVDMRVTAEEELWTASHKAFSWSAVEKGDAGLGLRMSSPLVANLHLLRRYMASPASSRLRDFLSPAD